MIGLKTIHLYLVGGLEHVLYFHILGIIIPTDEHIFPPTRSSSTARGLRSSCQGLCCLGDRDSAAAERAGELVEWYPAKSGTHRISVVVSMSCWKICLFSGNPPGNLLKTDCFCCSPHKHMQDNVARPRGNFDSYSEPPFFAAWLTI